MIMMNLGVVVLLRLLDLQWKWEYNTYPGLNWIRGGGRGSERKSDGGWSGVSNMAKTIYMPYLVTISAELFEVTNGYFSGRPEIFHRLALSCVLCPLSWLLTTHSIYRHIQIRGDWDYNNTHLRCNVNINTHLFVVLVTAWYPTHLPVFQFTHPLTYLGYFELSTYAPTSVA